MNEMSKIVKCKPTERTADSLDTFSTFVNTELRGIQQATNDIYLRRIKRQIQQVLMDAWDAVDAQVSNNQETSTSLWPSSPLSRNSDMQTVIIDRAILSDDIIYNE